MKSLLSFKFFLFEFGLPFESLHILVFLIGFDLGLSLNFVSCESLFSLCNESVVIKAQGFCEFLQRYRSVSIMITSSQNSLQVLSFGLETIHIEEPDQILNLNVIMTSANISEDFVDISGMNLC